MSIRRGPKPLDLTGKIFGWLMALRPTGESNHYGLIWAVRCQCGRDIEISASELQRKARSQTQAPRSCGCYCKTHRSSKFKGVGDLSKTKWSLIQASAKRRNLDFSITLDYAWNLFVEQDKKCALTGVPLLMSVSVKAGASTASLDRIDSMNGYVKGNLQWVHSEINDMKSNYSEKEFIEWCRKIVIHAGLAVGKEFGKAPADKAKHVY